MATIINVTGLTLQWQTAEDIITFLDQTVAPSAKSLGVDLKYKKGKIGAGKDEVTMKPMSVRPT